MERQRAEWSRIVLDLAGSDDATAILTQGPAQAKRLLVMVRVLLHPIPEDHLLLVACLGMLGMLARSDGGDVKERAELLLVELMPVVLERMVELPPLRHFALLYADIPAAAEVFHTNPEVTARLWNAWDVLLPRADLPEAEAQILLDLGMCALVKVGGHDVTHTAPPEGRWARWVPPLVRMFLRDPPSNSAALLLPWAVRDTQDVTILEAALAVADPHRSSEHQQLAAGVVMAFVQLGRHVVRRIIPRALCTPRWPNVA